MKLYNKKLIIFGVSIFLLTTLLIGCGDNQKDVEETNNKPETEITGKNTETKETFSNTNSNEPENNSKDTPTIGFDGQTLITNNFTVDITDYQVFKAGEEFGEYNNNTDREIITFWFDITVHEDSEAEAHDTWGSWPYLMEVNQGEKFLFEVTSPVDYDYDEDYDDLIKRGETVSRIISYELRDLEKPVQLHPDPSSIYNDPHEYGFHEYPLKWR